MSGASIEETLELWAISLREVKARMRPLFTQERVAALAGLFLDGLLGQERRKTGWMRAAAVGDPGPWRQQAICIGQFGGGAAGRKRAMTAKAARNSRSKTRVSLTFAAVRKQATGTPSPSVAM